MELDAITTVGLPRSRAGGSAPASDPAKTPTPAAAAASEEAAEQASEAMMRQAVERANRALAEKSRELTFEFDDAVKRVIVRLIDRNTGEVLRQIPSSEVVEIARLLDAQSGAGSLLRARA